MSASISKRTCYILIAILVIGAVIRFWNLTGPDLNGDDALYSVRAVHYFDYIGSTNTQTTPYVWFSEHAWWQGLSFHDAPPFVFLVQRVFFSVFGDSIFVARLPFVIAGLFSIWGMFLLVKQFSNERAGLIAAALFAIMNYTVWISRIGYLDGFVMLFVIFSLYFFMRARENPRYYYLWGICSGLGLLSKYTFLFMGLVFLVALLFLRRDAWRKKEFYLGIFIILILFSPVIIYNFMMYKTRGHFDAAFSTMAGQHPDDFYILTRSAKGNFDVVTVTKAIFAQMSLPFVLFFVLSFIIPLFYLRKIKREEWVFYVLIGLFSALLMLTILGGGERFSVITLPFLVLLAAQSAYMLFESRKSLKPVFMFALAPVILWEGLFMTQSELMPTPIVDNPFFVKTVRPTWYGYHEIERYTHQFYKEHPERSYIVFAQSPQIRNYQIKLLQKIYDSGKDGPQQEHLLVYDDRIDWSASVWMFERRRLYDVAAIPSLSNLLEAIDGHYIDKFLEFGFKDASVIVATDDVPYNSILDANSTIEGERLQAFAKKITARYTPVDSIKGSSGAVIANVFLLPLDEQLYALK